MADLDTLAIARSATAPLTPHGDGDRLMRRMLAITPAGSGADENASGANAAINLPALLDRYGGDAAKAWAASKIGADALDALVAKQGAGWFAAGRHVAKAHVWAPLLGWIQGQEHLSMPRLQNQEVPAWPRTFP